jgi:ferredoxin
MIVNRLIIPPAEAEKLVTQAKQVYLRECPCRLKIAACPREKWEVCLLFEHASEENRRQAKPISKAEAIRIVRMTSERGNIHQVFYFQEGERPYELCNCCTCCCRPLQEARDKGDGYQDQLHCGYVAVTDAGLCTGCGLCLESCFFEARQLTDRGVQLVDKLCFGCGRCLSVCPEHAIQLEYRAGRGVNIPSL